MLLGAMAFVIMLASAYAFWRQGVLSALVMVVNVLLAGLITFNFFEPIAAELDSMLADTFLHGYEDSLCLVALFSLTLTFLRWAANALIHTTIEYHPILQQGGAVLFGLLAGYLTAGFLLCVAQTLPLSENFLKFDVRSEANAPGAKLRRIMPPDRVWLALMHRGSIASLSWGEDSSFDPDGSYELRYGHERRIPPE
jgi:hypothetical protein